MIRLIQPLFNKVNERCNSSHYNYFHSQDFLNSYKKKKKNKKQNPKKQNSSCFNKAVLMEQEKGIKEP